MKKIYNSFARTMFSLALAVVCAVSANAKGNDESPELVNPYLEGDKVPYVDKDGVTKYIDKSEIIILTGDETVLTSGWYTTNGAVFFNHDVKIQGTVKLLLSSNLYTASDREISITCLSSDEASLEHAAIYGEADNDSICLYSFDVSFAMAQDKYRQAELSFRSSTTKKFIDVAHFVSYGPSVNVTSENKDAEFVNTKTFTMYNGYFGLRTGNVTTNTVNMYGGSILCYGESSSTVLKLSKINVYPGYADWCNFSVLSVEYSDETQEVEFPQGNVILTMGLDGRNVTRIDNKLTMKEFAEYVSGRQLSSFRPLQMADDKDWTKKFEGYMMHDVVMKFVGRTFVAGCYNTISLPALCEFNYLDDAFGKGNWTLKRLNDAGVDDETLTLSFVDVAEEDKGVYPFVPYLLKVEKEVKEPVLFGYGFDKMFSEMESLPTSFNGVSFMATPFSPVTVGNEGDDIESMLFLGANNTLYHPTSMPATIKAFRGYFLLEEPVYSAAKRVALNVDGNATSISALADDSFAGVAEAGEWYSLQGAKLGGKPSVAGIYIHNGKKVAIQK